MNGKIWQEWNQRAQILSGLLKQYEGYFGTIFGEGLEKNQEGFNRFVEDTVKACKRFCEHSTQLRNYVWDQKTIESMRYMLEILEKDVRSVQSMQSFSAEVYPSLSEDFDRDPLTAALQILVAELEAAQNFFKIKLAENGNLMKGFFSAVEKHVDIIFSQLKQENYNQEEVRAELRAIINLVQERIFLRSQTWPQDLQDAARYLDEKIQSIREKLGPSFSAFFEEMDRAFEGQPAVVPSPNLQFVCEQKSEHYTSQDLDSPFNEALEDLDAQLGQASSASQTLNIKTQVILPLDTALRATHSGEMRETEESREKFMRLNAQLLNTAALAEQTKYQANELAKKGQLQEAIKLGDAWLQNDMRGCMNYVNFCLKNLKVKSGEKDFSWFIVSFAGLADSWRKVNNLLEEFERLKRIHEAELKLLELSTLYCTAVENFVAQEKFNEILKPMHQALLEIKGNIAFCQTFMGNIIGVMEKVQSAGEVDILQELYPGPLTYSFAGTFKALAQKYLPSSVPDARTPPLPHTPVFGL